MKIIKRVFTVILVLFITVDLNAQFKDISVRLAEKKMKQNITVIDVRSQEEFAAGHLIGALNFNIKDTVNFLQQVNELDDNQPYLIYCRTGKRSAVAAKLMAAQGFNQLFNIKGGYVAWLKSKD